MPRTSWMDEDNKSVRIDDYARQLETFVAALADGRIDDKELADQEQRVIKLMKDVEPQLADPIHEQVTKLLCELSAFNVMQLLHSLHDARPKSAFRG